MTREFLDFVLDQLSGIDEVSSRRMFGGYGLYSSDVFFGIVFFDILYLKVNDATRGPYIRAGMKPFKPYDRPVTLQYYEVPAGVLEDRDELTKWAQRAIAAASQGRGDTEKNKPSRRSTKKD